jgi:hypothetical protein
MSFLDHLGSSRMLFGQVDLTREHPTTFANQYLAELPDFQLLENDYFPHLDIETASLK